MKTLEEVDDAFNPFLSHTVKYGSLVRLILEDGSRINRVKGLVYDSDKDIFVEEPWPGKKSPKQPKLVGIYEGCWGETDNNPVFEFRTRNGYEFSLRCSQIADYEVLKATGEQKAM